MSVGSLAEIPKSLKTVETEEWIKMSFAEQQIIYYLVTGIVSISEEELFDTQTRPAQCSDEEYRTAAQVLVEKGFVQKFQQHGITRYNISDGTRWFIKRELPKLVAMWRQKEIQFCVQACRDGTMTWEEIAERVQKLDPQLAEEVARALKDTKK